MKKTIILAVVLLIGAATAYFISEKIEAQKAPELPVWVESDSLSAIQRRIASDFSLSRAEVLEAIQVKYPHVTDADLDRFVASHYLEVMTIDGEQRFFRKSARNVGLLNPEFSGGFTHRGATASEKRISYVDSVIDFYAGKNPEGLSHQVTYRFSIDVPGNEAIADDTLRLWLPLPLDNDMCARQRNVEILAADPENYTLSAGKSVHNTVFFEIPSPAPGDTAHVEYIGRFITSGAFMPADEILDNIKPYNTQSDIYKKYTVFDNPHIIRLDSLAHQIVGAETNPFRQSELVYDYIISTYPWAGAREYSTIECIPEYVLTEGHGDCGQVSLLYISLMRTLGVPARWESGWMLHPGELNFHDWAEVYFEGIGWLPVDVSFGRYTGAENPLAHTFYSHGIDAHRFATNKGVNEPLYPRKKFIRSETVDFQAGEVEISKGNLFYPAWDSKFEIISVEPIKEIKE